MSDATAWLEVALAIGGLLILLFASRAFMSRHAWGDGAEYEMLDLAIPHHEPASTQRQAGREHGRPGAVGLEDRVIRFGFFIALNYLAFTWFGIGSPAMLAFVLAGMYALVTGWVGRDPLYALFGVSTTFH